MKMIDCPKFNTCNSPICPVSKRSVKKDIWYPGESVCTNVIVRKHFSWFFTQRKIQNKVKKYPHEAGAFTVEMLERVRGVGKKICGVIDDKKSDVYTIWLRKHPIKEAISEKEQKRRESLRNMPDTN